MILNDAVLEVAVDRPRRTLPVGQQSWAALENDACKTLAVEQVNHESGFETRHTLFYAWSQFKFW